MSYEIKKYSYDKAKELGVSIFPSDNAKYKIEIYDKNGVFIGYGGASNYYDYPSYLELESKGGVPKGYADKRRLLYHKRHKGYEKGTKGWYVGKILW
jgi:hypothetical protein